MGTPIPPVPPPSWENPPGEDCSACAPGETPLYLTVTLSGYAYCETCYNDEEGRSWLWFTWESLNSDYELTQMEGQSCVWFYETEVLWSEKYKWTHEDCEGNVSTDDTYEGMYFDVVRSGDALDISATIWLGGWYPVVVYFAVIEMDEEVCVEAENIANMIIDDPYCDEWPGKWAVYAGATATIVEGRAI